jgi:hypothetical protein
MDAISRPTSETLEFALGGLKFKAGIFGGRDWSLKDLYSGGDVEHHPDLVADLADALSSLGATRAFAPTPTKFNGELVYPDALQTLIPLRPGLSLWRQHGVYADGTLLERAGDACIFSGAGCSMIVAAYRGKCVSTHAGRDCVLDCVCVQSAGRTKGRQRESVVDSTMAMLRHGHETDFQPRDVEVKVLWSIKTNDFPHPPKGRPATEYDKNVYEYVTARWGRSAAFQKQQGGAAHLNIPGIIMRQFMDHGVFESKIDLRHTWVPHGYSTTRNGKPGRYLAIVVSEPTK